MEEEKIQEVLRKFRQGYELSADEQRLIEEWYNSFEEYEELTFSSDIEKDSVKQEMKNAIYTDLKMDMPEQKMKGGKTLSFRQFILRSAAAILVIVSAGGAWMYFSEKNSVADQAILYTEITAPQGKNNTLVSLPDSSTVWLHPGSKLRYPKQFANLRREVELVDGIAFFMIKHDEKKSFIVRTSGGIQTNVLGTVFNIKAYKALPDVEISLVSGAISVRDSLRQLGVLGPDQQIVYSRVTHKSELRNVPSEKYTSWLKGLVVLENASVEEVALMLQDLYKVKVYYKKEQLSPYRFNIQFSNKLSLTEVLKILTDISDINFKANGDLVNITTAE